MEIKQLDSSHKDAIKHLFGTPKYMGTNNETSYFTGPDVKFNEVYYNVFCDTYLSGLNNYKAFGSIENGIVTAVISFYESIDGPDWYWTQIRSINSKAIPNVLDAAIDYNESNGRLKFYSLFNLKYAKTYRRLAFSKRNTERYGFFDEFTVGEKEKCFYVMPWQVLYNRTLLPVESIVRCSFLKQEYRTTLPHGGNL